MNTDEASIDPDEVALNRLKLAVAQLAEHFDTVQIFCTVHNSDKDGTEAFRWSSGNYYARLGQVTRWIETERGECYENGRRNVNGNDM